MHKNFFELFGFEPGFDIDQGQLTARFKRLQKQFHPDRFVQGGKEEQRIAMQLAAEINEGYATLSESLPRAEYLLSLLGVDFSDHTLKSDTAFLMQQMEWREALESAKTEEKLSALLATAQSSSEQFQADFVKALAADDRVTAKRAVGKLHFVVKFQDEIARHLNALDS